jgi:predicted nucleotidyltransferase
MERLAGVRLPPQDLAPLRQLVSRLPLDRVVAVLVFGSVARGDDDAHSDIDVLVVAGDEELPAEVGHAHLAVSPLLLSTAGLVTEAAERPSFVAHLLDEAVVIYEDRRWAALRQVLAEAVLDPDALARELRDRSEQLAPLSRPERFRTAPITARSHLFGLARSLVILRLLQAGVHEYSWQRAFDRYADLRPDLRVDLEALKALRGHYEYARARPGAEPPDPDPGDGDIAELVAAVRHLID